MLITLPLKETGLVVVDSELIKGFVINPVRETARDKTNYQLSIINRDFKQVADLAEFLTLSECSTYVTQVTKLINESLTSVNTKHSVEEPCVLQKVDGVNPLSY
jgi:hypothetical protein